MTIEFVKYSLHTLQAAQRGELKEVEAALTNKADVNGHDEVSNEKRKRIQL